jgi:hypothetical protein
MRDDAMSESNFPAGWDTARVQKLIDHYEDISEDEQVAEDEEAASANADQAVVTVPTALLPEIRRLLAAHKAG